jgi:chromosome partitioning protein
MLVQASRRRSAAAHVVVLGNEKGGAGKSTLAMHVAIALMNFGQRVASIDLDLRQKSFTHYIENRRSWAKYSGIRLALPAHFSVARGTTQKLDENEAIEFTGFVDALTAVEQTHDFIVVDTAGSDTHLTRLAHSMADTLITPLNDSFVDLDVLGSVDPETFRVTGTSHYAEMVEEARARRRVRYLGVTDWIVLRNRLSTLGSRNRRLVGEGIQQLSQRLNFRCVEGLAERVIFREFYPRGLTAVDDLDELTLGTRPTMSHVSARVEMLKLLTAIGLGNAATSSEIVGRRQEVA